MGDYSTYIDIRGPNRELQLPIRSSNSYIFAPEGTGWSLSPNPLGGAHTLNRGYFHMKLSSSSAGLVKVCTGTDTYTYTDTDTDTDSLVCVLLPTPYMGRALRR